MDEYVSAGMAETRFALILLGILAGVACILSMIGVYGVVSYSMAERMNEFAIRIAVGAQTRDIVRLVLRYGLAPAISGAGIGVVSAFTLTRFLQTMLFDVSPTDTLTYAIACITLLAAALVACYIPVRTVLRRQISLVSLGGS
jgi:putative ABC transport system permease protein